MGVQDGDKPLGYDCIFRDTLGHEEFLILLVLFVSLWLLIQKRKRFAQGRSAFRGTTLIGRGQIWMPNPTTL